VVGPIHPSLLLFSVIMTRINVGVGPEELPDKLLLAEHREITRIPNAVRSGLAKMAGIPETFRLGAGHVKFFYDKLGYLQRRYDALYLECVARSFNVTARHSAFDSLPPELCGDYQETQVDRSLILQRIASKGIELLQV